MVQAQRKAIDPHDGEAFRSASSDSPIAHLQADLVRRLIDNGILEGPRPAASGLERRIRSLSAASGYIGLIVGYVGVGVAIACWMRG